MLVQVLHEEFVFESVAAPRSFEKVWSLKRGRQGIFSLCIVQNVWKQRSFDVPTYGASWHGADSDKRYMGRISEEMLIKCM